MICPSRGRPGNAAELIRLWPQVTADAMLLVAVDADDPRAGEYARLSRWQMAQVTIGTWPRGPGPILNMLAPGLAAVFPAAGFLGDDHRPRTPGWDKTLTDALITGAGVAYGDDGLRGEELPTAVVMSAALVRGLGYMCPPGLAHLHVDAFWKRLGTDIGNLQYRPDVLIEHMHPSAGKAAGDDGYARMLALEAAGTDRRSYEEFLARRWPGDLARLKDYLDR
jgi:hypothetical protein